MEQTYKHYKVLRPSSIDHIHADYQGLNAFSLSECILQTYYVLVIRSCHWLINHMKIHPTLCKCHTFFSIFLCNTIYFEDVKSLLFVDNFCTYCVFVLFSIPHHYFKVSSSSLSEEAVIPNLLHKNIFWKQDEVSLQYEYSKTERARTALSFGAAKNKNKNKNNFILHRIVLNYKH